MTVFINKQSDCSGVQTLEPELWLQEYRGSFEKIETLLAFDVMRFVDGQRSILTETYREKTKLVQRFVRQSIDLAGLWNSVRCSRLQ